MSRPLRSLMPFLWPALVLLALMPCVFVLHLAFNPAATESFFPIYLWLTPISAALYGWRHRWLWRLYQRAQGFATIENPRIVLHYEPELKRGENFEAFLQSCEKELDNLTQWFGSPLRGRLTVFLFAHWQDISAIFGPGYAGTALSGANAIVIPIDNRVPEMMRHELTHL